MARHVEPLHGGVWTKPDPSLLEPGQLSAGRNFVYLPGSPAIYRATGRTVFGTVPTAPSNVVGLRDAQFDGGPHVLASVYGSALATASITGVSGTFGVLTSTMGGAPDQLEMVQYRNRFYLLTGLAKDYHQANGNNKCLYVSATGTSTSPLLRQMGMASVNEPPSAYTAAGVFSQEVSGYYDYWTTEVAVISADGSTMTIESGFDPPSTTVFVSATGSQSVKIEMPSIRNSGMTTHWRVYRSTAKASAADAGFPTGYMIAEVPAVSAAGVTAATAVNDSGTASACSSAFPASANSAGSFFNFASASSAYSNNGVYASATGHIDGYDMFGPSQGYYAFNWSGVNGSIRGLEITVEAYASVPNASLTVWITPDRTAAGTILDGARLARRTVTIPSTSSTSPSTVIVGSPTDPIFSINGDHPLNASDFTSNFMVILAKNQSNADATTIGIDYVAAKVYCSAPVDSVVPFPTVVYTYGEESVQCATDGVPPSSSTGDVFQDMMVVNDVSDPTVIRYSYAGKPESFPATYFLNFESRENDEVKLIKVVNNRLMVALRSSLWRVNYLPTDNDASFDRGKAMEAVSRSYGVVGPMCACTFSPGGDSDLMAFVSNQGIHCTDGYSLTTLTDGIDWRGTIMTSGSTAIALVNDKENCILKFYFRNTNTYQLETDMCLPLCYGGGHWANGRAKIGGLIHVRNYSGGTFAELKSVCQLDHDGGLHGIRRLQHRSRGREGIPGTRNQHPVLGLQDAVLNPTHVSRWHDQRVHAERSLWIRWLLYRLSGSHLRCQERQDQRHRGD
jgi:hypothetical protein